MPQMILPLIPEGTTRISDLVCVHRDDKRWTYFMGLHPIYSHGADDMRMFRLFTSLLIDSAGCRHADIINVFGVSKSSVNRALKNCEKEGRRLFLEENQVAEKGPY